MVNNNNVVICPICKKRTLLRIQDGGYLDEYPVRVNCFNCRALLKGVYIMNPHYAYKGLFMMNADIEETDVNQDDLTINNADYMAEISGELPCGCVKEYKGKIPESPFMKAVDFLSLPNGADSVKDRIQRLECFNSNMVEWKREKSTAFQLFQEGSIEYVSKAINNRMGKYHYECDNPLKTIQCLQEVMLEETKYLFVDKAQDEYIREIIYEMALINKDEIVRFVDAIGGKEELINQYKKVTEVFSGFISIYANILPAETYMNYMIKDEENTCISTCSFSDIKVYYQDSYESLLSVVYIPICLDNIIQRGDFQAFAEDYNNVRCYGSDRDLNWYKSLDNGTKYNKLCVDEKFQKFLDFPAQKSLRNGIGHNNYKYDSITQKIIAYDMKNPSKIKYRGNLMEVAIECLRLAKSAVVISEMLLFLIRIQFRNENIHSIIHPRFYKDSQPNELCPCGSNMKYKRCCKREVEMALRKP